MTEWQREQERWRNIYSFLILHHLSKADEYVCWISDFKWLLDPAIPNQLPLNDLIRGFSRSLGFGINAEFDEARVTFSKPDRNRK